jgi:hypothetical protein
MSPVMLDVACQLTYGLGLAVIPMGLDKKPLVKWKEFQEKMPCAHDFVGWPNCNLAIVTGAISGICVIDCDTRDDAVWFWKNRAQSPVTVKTRRGVHLYFRHPGHPVKNGIKIEGRYDVRGDGGYVLAPPSTHDEGYYQWTGQFPFRVEDLPIFDMAWRPETTVDDQRAEKRVTDGVAYIATIKAVAGQGGHNETWRAIQRLKDSGLDKAEAMLAIIEWNQSNAEPRWSDKELLHKIRGVYA